MIYFLYFFCGKTFLDCRFNSNMTFNLYVDQKFHPVGILIRHFFSVLNKFNNNWKNCIEKLSKIYKCTLNLKDSGQIYFNYLVIKLKVIMLNTLNFHHLPTKFLYKMFCLVKCIILNIKTSKYNITFLIYLTNDTEKSQILEVIFLFQAFKFKILISIYYI